MRRVSGFAKLMLDRRVPLRAKLALVAIVGGYILFPADVLPDLLPLIGIADDGTVLVAAMALFTRYANGLVAKADEETSHQKANTD